MGSEGSVPSNSTVTTTNTNATNNHSTQNEGSESPPILLTVPVSVQSNTKYGCWQDDLTNCTCSPTRKRVSDIRIVRTPLLSASSSLGLSTLRMTARVVTLNYVEKWIGTNNMPMEHHAIEIIVFCLDCKTHSIYTFEYLGGVGKLDRAGKYQNQCDPCKKQRKIAKHERIYLSDMNEHFLNLPGKWKSRHYNAFTHNCQSFADTFWTQLFGANEDDHGHWISQTSLKCMCDTRFIYVQSMKLVRIQRLSDEDDLQSSLIDSTLNIMSLGVINSKENNEDEYVLYAVQLCVLCTICSTKVYYTLENGIDNDRGMHFRCGLFNRQLKPLRMLKRNHSLTLKNCDKLYEHTFVQLDSKGKNWAIHVWNILANMHVQSNSKKNKSKKSENNNHKKSKSKKRKFNNKLIHK